MTISPPTETNSCPYEMNDLLELMVEEEVVEKSQNPVDLRKRFKDNGIKVGDAEDPEDV